jgi:hypothetical protein
MFEVVAADLWEASLNLRPESLARAAISSQAKKPSEDFSDKDSGGKNPAIRFVESLIGTDFKAATEIGALLRRVNKFEFGSLPGISHAYSSAFGKDVEPFFLEPGLEVLHGVRNALVHSGGRVDRAFRIRAKRTPQGYETLGLRDIELNAMLPVDATMCGHLFDAGARSSVALIEFVSEWMRKHPSS